MGPTDDVWGKLLERKPEPAKQLWWLSFRDESRPPGQKWRGVCIVRASSVVDAMDEANLQGCSPGGTIQVMGCEMDFPANQAAVPQYINRLLTEAEAVEATKAIWGCGVTRVQPL